MGPLVRREINIEAVAVGVGHCGASARLIVAITHTAPSLATWTTHNKQGGINACELLGAGLYSPVVPHQITAKLVA